MTFLVAIRRASLFLGVALLVLAAGGCSSSGEEIAERIAEQSEGIDDVEISQTDDGVQIEVQSDQGDASLSVGTGDLPDDFPFPVPDGFSVTGSFTAESPDGPAYTAVLMGPSGAVDEVAAMYEQFLNDEGFEVTRQETSGGGITSVILGGVRGDLGASVVVSDGGAQTDLSLSWGG